MVSLRTHPLASNACALANRISRSIVVVVLLWIPINSFSDESAFVGIAGAVLVFLALRGHALAMTLQARRYKRLSRYLLRRIRTAKQHERNRTARELHDGVCQLLIATRHSLELAAERRASPQEFEMLYSRGMKQLADAIRETRQVAHGLKASQLSEQEFTDAFSCLGKEFAGRTRVCTNLRPVDATLDSRLTTPAKTALLRITQEALANVQKHSGASRVELTLENRRDHVELRIADNGHGFRERAAGTMPGIGIDNMRERATALGGSLLLRSSSSQTEVIARLPLPRGSLLRSRAP